MQLNNSCVLGPSTGHAKTDPWLSLERTAQIGITSVDKTTRSQQDVPDKPPENPKKVGDDKMPTLTTQLKGDKVQIELNRLSLFQHFINNLPLQAYPTSVLPLFTKWVPQLSDVLSQKVYEKG